MSDTLFIDGITRSGKTLLGFLMRCFNEVEKPEVCYVLEHIVGGVHSKAIEPDYAKEMFLSVLNERIYDISLSRNVNFRDSELTSASQKEFKKEYLKRLFEPDGDINVQRIRNRQLKQCFVTHELFLEYDWLIGLSNRFSYVQMIRNPLEVILSWEKKGWGTRFDRDIRSWRTILTTSDFDVPWFLYAQSEFWNPNLSSFDKIVFAVSYLTNEQLKLYSTNPKSNTVFTSNLFLSPYDTVLRIAHQFEFTLRENWEEIVKECNLPREAKEDKLEALLPLRERVNSKAYEYLRQTMEFYVNALS